MDQGRGRWRTERRVALRRAHAASVNEAPLTGACEAIAWRTQASVRESESCVQVGCGNGECETRGVCERNRDGGASRLTTAACTASPLPQKVVRLSHHWGQPEPREAIEVGGPGASYSLPVKAASVSYHV